MKKGKTSINYKYIILSILAVFFFFFQGCNTFNYSFGSSKRQGARDVPGEIRVLNIFGDTTLDFDDAKFTSMTTRINISSVFGSVKIFVPGGINVISNVSCILADIKDKASSRNDVNEPTIILDGFILFSGIKIKLKKTFRERLLQFAETVKTLIA